jgi:hypothetical protein
MYSVWNKVECNACGRNLLIVVPIYKKGNKAHFSNYGGI